MMLDDIVDIVGPSRTIGCVVELSSEIFTPGVVQRNTPPAHTWFGLGSIHESTEGREAEIEEILRHAGKVSISPEIVAAKWMKLVVNTMCLGPFAMLGLTLYEAVKMPGMKDFALQAGTEALSVGQSIGHTIQPIFGLTEEDVKDTNRLLEKLLDKLLSMKVRSSVAGPPSMRRSRRSHGAFRPGNSHPIRPTWLWHRKWHAPEVEDEQRQRQ